LPVSSMAVDRGKPTRKHDAHLQIRDVATNKCAGGTEEDGFQGADVEQSGSSKTPRRGCRRVGSISGHLLGYAAGAPCQALAMRMKAPGDDPADDLLDRHWGERRVSRSCGRCSGPGYCVKAKAPSEVDVVSWPAVASSTNSVGGAVPDQFTSNRAFATCREQVVGRRARRSAVFGAEVVVENRVVSIHMPSSLAVKAPPAAPRDRGTRRKSCVSLPHDRIIFPRELEEGPMTCTDRAKASP